VPDHTIREMTPEEIDAAMHPPTFSFVNVLLWTIMALVAAGFVAGRWAFYGWLYDHAPRWVSILIAGG
jgi:hypothetical protein